MIGIGSAQGDDVIAWCVIDRLMLNGDFIDNIRYIKCDRTPFDFWGQVPSQADVIMIDAVVGTDDLGEVRRFQLVNGQCHSLDQFAIGHSTHIIDTISALSLAQQIKALPASLEILGISIDPKYRGETISKSMARKLDAITSEIHVHLNAKLLATSD